MSDKKIDVELKIGENPEVRVDQAIWGRPKIKWVKDKDSIPFKFVDITGLPESVFCKTVADNGIDVIDKMKAGDYQYTIRVMTPDGKEYTTTETIKNEDPNERKPVIRN